MTAFAAIADDLTGACDVAAELAAAGRRVRVLVEPGTTDAHAEEVVVIVNTQSRALPASAAAARVREALAARPAALVLKKIDTALRGHLGAELDAALDACGATGFVLAAIPAAGRVTRGGCQWFGDRLLAETEFARDPEGPGALSSIPEVVARESERPVAVLGRGLASGGGLVSEVVRRRREGIELFVVDAESDDDVRAAVAAILTLPRPLCLAGSIALAAALAAHLPQGTGAAGVDASSVPLPALIVSGSLHSRARAQIDAVLARGAARLVATPAHAGDVPAIARHACDALGAGSSVVLAPPPAPSVPTSDALRATEATLADVSAAIASRTKLGTLVVIGGETSYAVLRRLGADAIDVHGRVAPLVAHGTILRGVAAGARLITKGGSGGDPDVIAGLLAASDGSRRAAEGGA